MQCFKVTITCDIIEMHDDKKHYYDTVPSSYENKAYMDG